jgi:hypothetical protein
MALIRAGAAASALPAVPRQWRPDPKAVMEMIPVEVRLIMGQILYGDREPKSIPSDDIFVLMRTAHDPSLPAEKAYRDRVVNRGTAIRGFCVLCQGGSPKQVRLCDDVTCPLWVFRMGGNPLSRRR